MYEHAFYHKLLSLIKQIGYNHLIPVLQAIKSLRPNGVLLRNEVYSFG